MATRTQEQILARHQQLVDGMPDSDWLGFRREVLIQAMTRDTAQTALRVDLTAEAWNQADVEADAREYLTFAIGKAVDHRGISASRSVDKLSEYAWLLCRDDVVAAMGRAEYEQYGVPKLKAFAEGMGWPWPGDLTGWRLESLNLMALGRPCEPDCMDGCS